MTTFLLVQNPIGVAATQDGVFFTTSDGNPPILKATDAGEISVFAPALPAGTPGQERYLDVNPGLGPWVNKVRFVYVTQGPDVFEITPNGCTVRLFCTIPSNVTTHTGITFDRIGTFNYDMIVTSNTGDIFRVTPDGIVDLPPLISLGKGIENPAVVPTTLGPNGGEIWVASEGDGAVYSVSEKGKMSTIVKNIPNAENVRVIPMAPINFGVSGGAYFAADFPSRIVKFPAADFFGFGGNVLIGSESPGPLTMISYDATMKAYQATPFMVSTVLGVSEGAAFVECLSHTFVYSAKFVCGRFEPKDRDSGPVLPGTYSTAINVHNPNYCPVTISEKAVLLFDGSLKDGDTQTPRPPHKPITIELGPDWGVEIDCADIRDKLLKEPSGVSDPKASIFIKGWVVIESLELLDVVAVYTARGLDGNGLSITTDRIIPTHLS